jgi:hypothetical protein
MRFNFRTLSCWLGIGGLMAGTILASPGLASAAIANPASGGGQTCTGTVDSPGTLAGNYGNLVITGACVVNAGPVTVNGNLTIASGGALTAIFGLNDQTNSGNSNMTVHGNLVVDNGGSLMLGCYSLITPLWGVTQLLDLPDFPCTDDPNQSAPTLNTQDVVDGNLVSNDPLGVVVHNTTIRGNVVQNGGGAGTGCVNVGIFNKYFGLPEWSDYASNTVGGNLVVNGMDTCWDGAFRNIVHGNMTLTNNTGGVFFGAADANEFATNTVYGNLACSGNNPATQLGDSDGSPNKVAGNATGECGFNVQLPNPGPNSGVEVPPTFQPASVKFHP